MIKKEIERLLDLFIRRELTYNEIVFYLQTAMWTGVAVGFLFGALAVLFYIYAAR